MYSNLNNIFKVIFLRKVNFLKLIIKKKSLKLFYKAIQRDHRHYLNKFLINMIHLINMKFKVMFIHGLKIMYILLY